MASKPPRQIDFVWGDIMACMYCEHYVLVGAHAPTELCQNNKSPFYDHSATGQGGTRLTTAQAMGGCEQLLFDNRQIPPEVFRHVPKDSQLRRLAFKEVVAGYSVDMELDSDETVAELAGQQQAQVDKLMGILEDADGPVSTAELLKRVYSD